MDRPAAAMVREKEKAPKEHSSFHMLVRQLTACYNLEAQELDQLRVENAALRHRVHDAEERQGLGKARCNAEVLGRDGGAILPGTVPKLLPLRGPTTAAGSGCLGRQPGAGDGASCLVPQGSGEISRSMRAAATAGCAECVQPDEDSPKTPGSSVHTGLPKRVHSELSGATLAVGRATSWSFSIGQVTYPPARIWLEKQDGRQIELAARRMRRSHLPKEPHDVKPAGAVKRQGYNYRVQRWIANPASPKRLVWDLVGALLILYDLIVLPLQVCFQLEDTLLTTLGDWLTLLYWTVNMPMSCMVGYSSSGEVVMAPFPILKNYLRAWFWLDLAVVVPDWIFSIASLATQTSRDQNSETVKLFRILRLTRIVRLLRLLKLRKIFKNFDDLLNTECTSILSNVAKMILLMLAINHFVACFWFLVADSQEDSPTWLKEQRFVDQSWQYWYMTALHWSLTQFTPASIDVHPQNIAERTFTVFIVVFGLVGFSYNVGSITGSLSQLRQLAQTESKQFWDLRRFLRQNKVPVRLSLRIQRYLEHAWQSQNKTREIKSIAILGLLSEHLLSELQYELNRIHFIVHPLFKRLCDDCSETMQRLSKTAVSIKHLARDDFLFLPAEKATHMSLVVDGRLDYSRYISVTQETKGECVEYNEDWIAEPILWTQQWVHLGTLTAVKESVLLLVEPDEFRQKLSVNPHAFWLGRRYAEKFLMWLNEQRPEDLSDITQGEDQTEMLSTFIPLQAEAFCQSCSTTREASTPGSGCGSGSGLAGFFSARRGSG